MAKIARYNGNLQAFASAAIGTERTLFGEVTQANDLTSQFTPDFLRGWGIVGPSDQPTLEDFNGAMYTHGQLLAYLHQMGVAEYNAAQEYAVDSIATFSGSLYISLAANNIGNNPAVSPASWKAFVIPAQATELVSGIMALASSAEALAGANDTKAMTALKVKQAITSLTPNASESVKGILQLATQAQANARTDDTTAVTPLKLGNGFVLVTATAGYIKLPTWMGGLIIQWTTITSSGTGSPNVTGSWPMVFPNAVFSVTSNAFDAAAGLFTRLITKTLSGFTGTVGTYNSNNNAIPVMLIAVGY